MQSLYPPCLARLSTLVRSSVLSPALHVWPHPPTKPHPLQSATPSKVRPALCPRLSHARVSGHAPVSAPPPQRSAPAALPLLRAASPAKPFAPHRGTLPYPWASPGPLFAFTLSTFTHLDTSSNLSQIMWVLTECFSKVFYQNTTRFSLLRVAWSCYLVPASQPPSALPSNLRPLSCKDLCSLSPAETSPPWGHSTHTWCLEAPCSLLQDTSGSIAAFYFCD